MPQKSPDPANPGQNFTSLPLMMQKQLEVSLGVDMLFPGEGYTD